MKPILFCSRSWIIPSSLSETIDLILLLLTTNCYVGLIRSADPRTRRRKALPESLRLTSPLFFPFRLPNPLKFCVPSPTHVFFYGVVILHWVSFPSAPSFPVGSSDSFLIFLVSLFCCFDLVLLISSSIFNWSFR